MRFHARRLPSFDTLAAWAEILGPYPEPTSLQKDTTADVTIIGAGFAGLSAARRLRQLDPNLSVVVLDALRVSEGTAGRNSGFMIDLPHDLTSDDYAGGGDEKTLIGLNRLAIAFAQDAVAEYQINPAYADPVGKINGAATEAGAAHNQAYAKHLKALGENCETLDAQTMQHITGSKHYQSGLFTPGTLMLQPAGYIQGFASGLKRDGVVIHEHSPVIGFEKETGGWRVQTATAKVSTRNIILANNGHLESFGIAKGQLLQLFLYASMTDELDKDQMARLGGQARWGITPADPMGTTMRRIDSGQGGNRIITRTCATLRPGMTAKSSDMRRARAVHYQKFAERFPALAGISMAYAWAGHLCLTLNGVGWNTEVADGVQTACVQNGLGTARGTLSGIAAAERLLGHTSEITCWFAREAAPKKLPPQPLATWGANAYLRWKEWRAGAE